jgi:maltose O-acetyltransferase
MNEKEKMLSEQLYNPIDPELLADRQKARLLLKTINELPYEQVFERKRLLRALFPLAGSGLWIQPPFYCDYGSNIRMGKKVFFNFNCVVLDAAPVIVGEGVNFGPGVQVYTSSHPMDTATRRTGLQFAKSVHIGDDAWIGGGVVICPGTRIGARSIIGAGSVVTRDIPEATLAVGNPCRVIRQLES